jgi:hypothetical protein
MSTSCTVAKVGGKVAALPVKTVYKTGEIATKGTYYTGKGAGTLVYKTGEYAGKGTYYTAKGVYKTVKVPVTITNAALDTSNKALSVTTKVVDLSGKTVTLQRNLNRSEAQAYIDQAQGAANVLSVLVDIAK